MFLLSREACPSCLCEDPTQPLPAWSSADQWVFMVGTARAVRRVIKYHQREGFLRFLYTVIPHCLPHADICPVRYPKFYGVPLWESSSAAELCVHFCRGEWTWLMGLWIAVPFPEWCLLIFWSFFCRNLWSSHEAIQIALCNLPLQNQMFVNMSLF